MNMDRRAYWEKKIIQWERTRYSFFARFNPFSWTIRRRRAIAAKIINSELKDPNIIEFGCGSGTILTHILYNNYQGYDFSSAAINHAKLKKIPNALFTEIDLCKNIPKTKEADITIMLGLTDWLMPHEIVQIFSNIQSQYLLFSFTKKDMRAKGVLFIYKLYRKIYDKNKITARQYDLSFFNPILEAAGYNLISTHSSFIDPGVLLLWKIQKKQ